MIEVWIHQEMDLNKFEILTGTGAFLLCLAFVCVAMEASDIEEELARQARAEIKAERMYWASVEPNGQRVILTGAAVDYDSVRRARLSVEGLPGVVAVENQIAVIGETGTCQQEFDKLLADERVLFKSGSSEISQDSFELLRLLATIARGCNVGIEIAGHTDGEGDARVNHRLSQRRAEAVRRHLVSSGVAPFQVSARGYGEAQPIADNNTAEGRRVNRRIEFRVLGAAA